MATITLHDIVDCLKCQATGAGPADPSLRVGRRHSAREPLTAVADTNVLAAHWTTSLLSHRKMLGSARGSPSQGQQGQQRSPHAPSKINHSAESSAVGSKPGYRAITAPLERSLRSSSTHFQSESTLASWRDTATRSCTFWHEVPHCSVNGVLRRRSSLLLPFGSTQALHSRLQPWRTVP